MGQLVHFSEDDLEQLEDHVGLWAEGFRLSDYDINVRIGEGREDNKDVYAETSFRDHWTVFITFYPKFFDSDPRTQVGTIVHELFHVMHKEVDTFVEAALADNDAGRAVYEEVQEKFIEHLERGFLFLSDILASDE